ncbi:MAG: preQ(1) synthase [Armatimonadota bacterium]
MREYTEKHAKSGIKEKLPRIECWENQYKNYGINFSIPEFTSICPKTGLPDSGTITISYVPDKLCLEMKSLKFYLLAYRDMGIFCENAVNRILKDVVNACKPVEAHVMGEFASRGGMELTVDAGYKKGKGYC